MNNKIRFMTRTAILLAIAIVFQLMGKYMGPYNNFIVGPVVNAVLIVATEIVGIFSGLAISIIAPIVSVLTNKSAMAPVILAFSPFIIAGNSIIVLCYALLKKKSKVLALGTGAVLKFGFLFGSIILFTNNIMKVKEAVAVTLTNLFGWTQLITAIIGGIIALIVLIPLKRAVKE